MSLPLPRPLFAEPVPSLRWGVIGTNWIAAAFVRAVTRRTDQRVVAVAARDAERTAAFAATHGIPRVHAQPQDLIEDPAVDVVHIATPHSAHAALALAAIAAGKHVLVEKPLAASARDAREVADAARAAGVLVMEAMWTRYLPQADVLRQLLAAGTLGDVHQVDADFGFATPYDPAHRLWNPDLAGGALLDVGVYPISFASSVLGTPVRVQASGQRLANGVDLRASALLTSAGGAVAMVATSIVSELPNRALVVGSHGRLELRRPFYAPTETVLTTRAGGRAVTAGWTDDTFHDPYDALSYEAVALAGYAGQGRVESPLHPLDEVVSVLTTIEQVSAQLGVVPPPE
ncbi:MAG: Gfo/Idh/MocA family oxidoreductase [Actinobacteria bacterium]|nr:Gfo/Idh/MocA family oxidoreductase [Actinomycetota bacterium]